MNKIPTGAATQPEGVDGELIDALTLALDDAELLRLSQSWEAKYRPYEAKIKQRQDACKTYYLGRQNEGSPNAALNGQPISSNLLFEAVETFLPAALSKNPEPVVWSDDTAEGDELSNEVKTMLQYHADNLVLRRKLTLVTRNWLIYFLGVIKHGWDEEIKDIKSEVRDPRNFIFDPEGFVDCYGDYEGPLGERITITAEKLIDLFPKHERYIKVMVDGKMGTDVTYTEWWNDDYCFYTFKGKILEKNKNPHFNYPKEVPVLDQQGVPVIGEDGQPETEEKKGNNHFGRPKKPYTFLTVFSLGEQPHDMTSLIEQNIPNQRRISRRTDQIDFNLTRQNNSDVFSENNFTQETAKQAATATAKGHPVLVPSGGPISEAIVRLQAQGLDGSFFNELETSKNDLRTIFGTQGITATQQDEDQTARGMILNNQYDNSRIGGGIGDALEQFAKNVFNWWTQFYYVYYDEKHFAAIMGQMKAVEYVTLSSRDFDRRLIISVSPDSMKPHDEITEMNQALSLYEAGVLDPKTLLTMVNVPDPQDVAESTILWLLDKNAYLQLNFPQLAQQLQQMTQQQAAQGQQPGQSGGQAPPGNVGAGQQPASQPGNTGEPPAGSSLSSVPIPQ